jgi:hypothetical protein
MSKHNSDKPRRPPVYNRDRARPHNAPALSDPAVEQRLSELVQPITYGLLDHYRRLGLRERVLTLPITVAMVLAMIWRQFPSVAELLRSLALEGLLWVPPMQPTEAAFNQRLRCLPAPLFGEVFGQLVPTLLQRARERTRPQPPVITRALAHFQQLWVLDASTLEAVARKVGVLHEATGTVLGGKLLAVLDLPSKLPIHLWLDAAANANEKSFLDQVKVVLQSGTLLLLDRGFYSFAFFDHLTEQGLSFVTRARSLTAFKVEKVLVATPQVRDRIVALGQYRSNPCRHPVRLVEVEVGGNLHAYLTNVLDPAVLSTADVVDLYGRRWRIEEAFLLVKRLLGLAYLWREAHNAIALQVWGTWLLYAMLIDLSDAVAQELNLPLDRISVEMVFRGLYHFAVAQQYGQASDPVTYLAEHPILGVVKRRRKYRERERQSTLPSELML